MSSNYYCDYIPTLSVQKMNSLKNDLDEAITLYNYMLACHEITNEVRLEKLKKVLQMLLQILNAFPGLVLNSHLLKTLHTRIDILINKGG